MNAAVQTCELTDLERRVLEKLQNARGFFKTRGMNAPTLAALIGRETGAFVKINDVKSALATLQILGLARVDEGGENWRAT